MSSGANKLLEQLAWWLVPLLPLLAGAPTWAQATSAEMRCGGLANAFGPFDYRAEHFRQAPNDNQPWAEKLSLVERGHFTPQVEALIRGQTMTTPGSDLDYTLRAVPNHHRALASLLRLSERHKDPAPAGLPRTIECYFDRATRFVQNDPIVRLLYASFLFKQKRSAEAKPHIEAALRMVGDNPFSNYNIGLIYLEAGEYEAALAQAHRAFALGFPRQELKQRLVALGKWSEPPAAPSAAASSPTPGAPAASAAAAAASSTSTNP